MTTTVSEATELSSASVKVRSRLRFRCSEILRRAIPESDSGRAQGTWSEETIRTLTAVFELQRVELHSELEDEHIHNRLVAEVIESLTARAYFHDPRSDTLLFELEGHLRLLAAALRIYKYHGKSLDHNSHQAVYDGITKLSTVFENHKSRRPESQRVDDRNVAFLLKHCQFLLVSIDSSQSLSRELARRAIMAMDGALAGFGSQYHELRPRLAEIIKRKRIRPSWHDEFMSLEDACWSVFASDIHMRSHERDIIIERFIEEACLTTFSLKESLKNYLKSNVKQSKVSNLLRQSFGRTTDILQEAGPYEEHSQYFLLGLLDLLYQLSFRIRKRAREHCFVDFLKMVRMILEQSPSVSSQVHLKATDLWNRVSLLSEKDNSLYGEEEDRNAIAKWVKQHEMGAELFEYSETRSKRIQSQLRKLRKEEEGLLSLAGDDARVIDLNTVPNSAGPRATTLSANANDLIQESPRMQSRVEILEDLLDSEPTPEEAAVISQLFRQPRIQRLLADNAQQTAPILNTSLPTGDTRSESESVSVQEEAGSSRYLHSPTSAHEDESTVDVDESAPVFARRKRIVPGELLMEEIPRIPFPPMRHSSSHTEELELHSFLDDVSFSPSHRTSESRSSHVQSQENLPSAHNLFSTSSHRSLSSAGGSQDLRRPLRNLARQTPSVRSSISHPSQRSLPQQLTSVPTHSTSAISVGSGEMSNSRETFTPQTPVKLRHSSQSIRRSRIPTIISTCVSGSGNSIAIVRETEFQIYKDPNGRYATSTPKYVGRFEPKGEWTSGLDGAHLTNHGILLKDPRKCHFGCAAMNDNLLVAGASVSNCLMVFSIAEEPKPGRCIVKQEDTGTGRIIRKVLFNGQGTEFTVLSTHSASHQEIWQFYSVGDLLLRPVARRNSSSMTELVPQSEVPVQMKFRTDQDHHVYTVDAKYSEDGRKVVACTSHSHGTALVSILRKEEDNIWRLWGTCRIGRELHNWDVDCLGFTGVSFYRQHMSDDAVLFSVDFPRTNPKDFFGIRNEGDSFVLETLRRRCCSDGKSSVAVAVSSHGQADVAAILKRDGSIILYQGKGSTEVGAVARIRTAEQTSLNEIRQSLTLAFTQDGMKLILIDDQGEVRIFNRHVSNSHRSGVTADELRQLQ